MKGAWLAAAALCMGACSAAAQSGVTVRGTVVNAATGRPVAGAAVVLEGAEESYVVESDGDGRFHAEEVVPGRYSARAEREGYLAPSRAKGPVRFTVEAGQAAPSVLVQLIPLGVISGRVVDADGDPLSKVAVTAQAYGYRDGRRVLKTVGRATSDDRGEYRIGGLPAGEYYLNAEGAFIYGRSIFATMQMLGTRPAYEFAGGYFPAADDLATAVLVKLRAGGELRDHTITLHAAPMYTLRITLNGSSGTGPPPTMNLTMPGGGNMMMTTRYGQQRTFPNLKPGLYIVDASDKSLGLSARQAVKISNADVDVVLTPRAEGTVRGKVRTEGKAVMDAVRVRADAVDIVERLEAAPAGDGTFAFETMRAANYRLGVATPPGSYLKAVRIGDRVVTDPVMDMGRVGGLVEITLATDGGTLEGTAVDAQGAPVEGAVAAAAPMGARGEWMELVRSAVSDRDGRFTMRDLAPGEYQVWAWTDAEEGAEWSAEFRKRFEARAVAVKVDAGTPATVKVTGIE